MQLGTPCRGSAGASCASGYGGEVLVPLATLALLALAGTVLIHSTRRVEAAAQIVTDLDTEAWGTQAQELRDAGEQLRDAVDLREHR